MIGVATPNVEPGGPVDADLDTLATALYVTIDDLLQQAPHLAPWRPRVGIAPKLTDAELVTLAVMQALLGFVSEARWLRYAGRHLGHLLSLPARPVGLQQAAAAGRRAAARYDPGDRLRHHAVERRRVGGGLHPVECGRSRETAKRSELAGWATYGYCASHSRYFWGLRLHLVCTLHGLPVAFALTGAKAVEREVLLDVFAVEPQLVAARPGQVLLADKNYYGGQFERLLGGLGLRLLRPARKGEPERAGAHLFKPLRQLVESVNQTFKGQLDLERHGGRTGIGVAVRVLQRILALTAAIWHNDKTGQPTLRSLVPTTTDPLESIV